MNNLLLPSWMRYIGISLMIIGIIIGLLILFSDVDYFVFSETVVNDLCLVNLILGAVFTICAKVSGEDEYTSLIRLQSIFKSLYINTLLTIFGICLFDSFDFILFLTADLVLIPLVYSLVFGYEYHKYLKINDNE